MSKENKDKKIAFKDILKTTLISDEHGDLIQKQIEEIKEDEVDEANEQINDIDKQAKQEMEKKISKEFKIDIDALKGKVIDLNKGVISSARNELQEEKGNRVILENAQSRMAEIIAPNYGSDREFIEQGKVDIRRFTNIKNIDVIWLTHFLNVPDHEGGEYAKDFCMDYMNLRDSVNGEHKKIGIRLQQALNASDGIEELTDNRNWIEKHITKRGEEPNEFE
jgi:hypothetical protein